MRKILLTLTIIYSIPTISTSQQQDIESEYQICIKALNFIKAKNTDALKELIYKDAFKNMSDEQFTKVVNEIHDIVNGEENPTKDMALIMTSISQFNGQNTNIYSLGFPFPSKSKREDARGVQITFMFSKEIKKNKIVGWKVRDFEVPLVRQEQEDKKNIPQLDKFDFASKHIDWFRIVYKTAPSVEDFFVFSGDSLTMKKANITSKVDEILGLITKAKIEKKDYNKTPINIRPNIEFCVLELKLSNYDFKLYREFEISLVSSGDSKTMEEYGGYLVVRHSGSFRYFIKTNDNPTIVDKIIELRKMIF